MNRDHRRIIHELAQIYGIESVSYDNEPKRNVVITAVKYAVYFILVCKVIHVSLGITVLAQSSTIDAFF